MSGGPPHHPHSRQTPAANTAWNHLQVPNYFPSRQPQHAHMSNEHPLLHQPTWHTPSTEPVKGIPHSHLYNLEQMLTAPTDRPYSRHAPGVDLSLTRNGSQNGDLPTTPISLSVRDAHKINSLPPSALEIQAVELTKCVSPTQKSLSPGLKSLSPGLKSNSPGLVSCSPGIVEMQGSPRSVKRPSKRVDSILERLNHAPEKSVSFEPERAVEYSVITEKAAAEKDCVTEEKTHQDKPMQSVIVQASSSHDENSNSSSIQNVPTPTNTRDDDVVSPYSNEDSLDSSKSRRKRKPTKTVRVSKEDDKTGEAEVQRLKELVQETTTDAEKDCKTEPLEIIDEIEKADIEKVQEETSVPERHRSNSEPPVSPTMGLKTRRKTSSESETIANIAAMVQESLAQKNPQNGSESSVELNNEEKQNTPSASKPISVSVIKTKDNLQQSFADANDSLTNLSQMQTSTPLAIITPAQKKANTNTHFVEVENKLEEMFAGIDDSSDPLKTETLPALDDSRTNPLEDIEPSTSQMQDVTSTSNDFSGTKGTLKRGKRKASRTSSRRSSECNSLETTPRKKKSSKKSKNSPIVKSKSPLKNKTKKSMNGKQINNKIEAIKDVYAYDSGSNASSSRSRGPFIQIRGPRDSPLSVNVINAPLNDDDSERKTHKTKKFHDDSEYRHKVRSKGLHCSTLSNKYDAQTRDISWICAFCKRGPHTTDLKITDLSAVEADITSPPGDLFGPYVISNRSPEYERRLADPYDRQFKSKKVNRNLEVTNVKITGKKSKRKHSESFESRLSEDSVENSEVYLGITNMGNNSYEVWAHEECIVWSPGIYLIGPKIVGLEEAIWTSCNVPCNRCHLKGANICCLKRGCMSVMHFCCARVADWQLDEDTFSVYCVMHKNQ